MKYLQALLLASATIFAITEACGCYNPGSGRRDTVSTNFCCQRARGRMNGNDCAASSMSSRLSTFAGCCRERGGGLRSDCNCPVGCGKKKRLVDGVMFAEWIPEVEAEAEVEVEVEEISE